MQFDLFRVNVDLNPLFSSVSTSAAVTSRSIPRRLLVSLLSHSKTLELKSHAMTTALRSLLFSTSVFSRCANWSCETLGGAYNVYNYIPFTLALENPALGRCGFTWTKTFPQVQTHVHPVESTMCVCVPMCMYICVCVLMCVWVRL